MPLALSSGCSLLLKPHQQHSMAYKSKELSVTPEQIRLRMRALVQPFAGEIENSADEIAAGVSEVSVKRAAIRWKIEGVPAMRTALFQPNPFTAVLDTWVLLYQMADYFETGPGREEFGPAASRAVDTCLHMENEFNQIISTFPKSRDATKVRVFAKKWAKDHPIRFAIRDRETTLSRVTEQDIGIKWSTGTLIVEVATTADDINRQMQIYSDHLFRQATWEAELLKLDLPSTDAVFPLAQRAVKSSERAVDALDDLAPSIKTAVEAGTNAADAVTKFTSDVAKLVPSERKAAVDAINQDLRETLRFIDRERAASFDQMSQERIALVQQLDEERKAATQELRDIASKERMAFSQDIEQNGLQIVDHAASRLSQLVAISLAFLFLAAVLFLFIVRRLSFHRSNPVNVSIEIRLAQRRSPGAVLEVFLQRDVQRICSNPV
jgi:hypothetical protein